MREINHLRKRLEDDSMFIWKRRDLKTGEEIFTLTGKPIDRELFEFLRGALMFEKNTNESNEVYNFQHHHNGLNLTVGQARAMLKKATTEERRAAGAAKLHAYNQRQSLVKNMRVLRDTLRVIGMSLESQNAVSALLTDEQRKIFSEIA
jgi:hypothetical protein